MKVELERNEYYTEQILTTLNNLIHDEDNQTYCYVSIEELIQDDNLTEFFIGYLKAGTYMFNEFTGDNKNILEFTHILNHLCVQDLLEHKDKIKL